MKHWSLWILFGVSLLFGVSCGKEPETPQPVMVKGITLSASSLTLTEGETANLVATISPKDADNKTVIWSSSNGSVASVDNGKVTAIKAGETTITAKSDDGGFTATCSVTVNPKIIEVTSITLSTEELSLVEGESETLVATVKPDDATDKTVTWNSSDTSIATVEDGKVTAHKEGSATITAKAGEKSTTCTVKVSTSTISVTGVSLNLVSLSMNVGDTQTLTATVSPSYATNKAVTWSSSNTSVASVSSSGVVTAKAAGTATITVKTKDGGKTANCTVKVSASSISVSGVSLNKTSLSLTVGNTQTLTATITPSNATNKEVTWSSSNTSVATVTSSGVVTAKAAGTATITVKTKDGGKTATCSVTVKAATVSVTGVSLNVTALSMAVGDTQTLTATITPSNATNKEVTWSSSNTSVATVSSSGVVTAKAAGTATITVKTKDGSKTSKCSVTVKEADSPKGYKVFIKHGGEFDYDSIPEEGTYVGNAFTSPNTKYNYTGDNHELYATSAEFNNVFRELGMTEREFKDAYDVDGWRLIVKDAKNGEPGDLPDEGKYEFSTDLANLGGIYSDGLTITKLYPSNWGDSSMDLDMRLDSGINIGGPHFVYVVYPAKDNTKHVDVVVKFVYIVKHDHAYTLTHTGAGKWLLNSDYILGDQDELNPKDPVNYNSSYAPYNKDDKGYGAIGMKSLNMDQEHPRRSGLTGHFLNYMTGFDINDESIYKFEIKNYDIREVDWEFMYVGGNYGTTTYKDRTEHAYVEYTGTELKEMIMDPASVPYIYLTDEASIAKYYDVLIEVEENCEKLDKAKYGYYFVVFDGIDLRLKLYNVKLGSFNTVDDFVYAHELVEGIYDAYNNKIFEWKNGKWAATAAARSYGITETENLTVEVKSVLTFPYDSEESFGGNLFSFPKGLPLPPTNRVMKESGIDWWNYGYNLQVDKKAQFTVRILWGEDILAECVGTVLVLANNNSSHPLHNDDGTIQGSVVYKDGWFYAINDE